MTTVAAPASTPDVPTTGPGATIDRGADVGLLRDLPDLVLLRRLVTTSGREVGRADRGADRKEFADSRRGTGRQLGRLRHRLERHVPQALLAT